MADIALLASIEQKNNGPLPPRDRWIVRFGDTEAYRRAKAKSVIRHTTLQAQKILERWKRTKSEGRRDDRQDCTKSDALRKNLKSEVRVLLAGRAKWTKFLREASKAAEGVLIGLLALATGAASA